MNKIIEDVTNRIIKRSKKSRDIYLKRISDAKRKDVNRASLDCANLAHAIAPMNNQEKEFISEMKAFNMGIVTAYNDMLSAHEPYSSYPLILKKELLKYGSTAQVSGGVPAMCDGVTQGQPGMELSLFSRDNIAMGSAIALSHNTYDGAFFLGICDKIVPGLMIGALSFGHLPAIFVPSGPMPSGISNKEKAKVREDFAQKKVDEKALFKVETASYHSCGTCTFFGTANSSQMLLEMMGLQLPNSSFVNTNTPLREALTKKAAKTLIKLCSEKISISDIVNEKSFVNAIVGLMATGGSTNHTIHLIAMAKAAGIVLTWEDFDDISKVIPLLCKMYPNGSADVNDFREAGGMSVVISQLLEKDLLHNDVQTVVGYGLDNFIKEPVLQNDEVIFANGEKSSKNKEVISVISNPFSNEGGLKLLVGDLGKCVIKTSALKDEYLYIKAPAIVFNSQEELQKEFVSGNLEKDFIAVVIYQGPKANGMPELHKLMPPLGVLQEKGFKVAIITDGRMSGASGKVASAIHLYPEAIEGGIISKIENGDIIEMDIKSGVIKLFVDKEVMKKREIKNIDLTKNRHGFGRELFSAIRENVSSSESGATIFKLIGEENS